MDERQGIGTVTNERSACLEASRPDGSVPGGGRAARRAGDVRRRAVCRVALGGACAAANDGQANVVGIFPEQVFVRLGAPAGSPGHALRVGRMEFVEGAEVAARNPALAALERERIAHRLLGTFAFSHVGRSLDGGLYAYDAGAWNATALAARATQGVFNVDGWPGLDVTVGYAAVTRRDSEARPAELRAFVLPYHDAREPTAALPSLHPWVPLSFTRSDGDAADGRPGTFFQVLPTSRTCARLPFYNLTNLEEAAASLVLRPGPGRARRFAEISMPCASHPQPTSGTRAAARSCRTASASPAGRPAAVATLARSRTSAPRTGSRHASPAPTASPGRAAAMS
jgi:hypothetical protein